LFSPEKQRKEVVFVRFPDEDHELSRAGPRHRLERFASSSIGLANT
jgi:dipeptidyl aminopeptidase/acylaminoacyl peptidase